MVVLSWMLDDDEIKRYYSSSSRCRRPMPLFYGILLVLVVQHCFPHSVILVVRVVCWFKKNPYSAPLTYPKKARNSKRKIHNQKRGIDASRYAVLLAENHQPWVLVVVVRRVVSIIYIYVVWRLPIIGFYSHHVMCSIFTNKEAEHGIIMTISQHYGKLDIRSLQNTWYKSQVSLSKNSTITSHVCVYHHISLANS